MNRRLFGVGSLPAIGWLLGCATVDPSADYQRAGELVRRATGAEQVFRPEDDESVEQRVEQLLEGGLTAGEAVEFALLNNATLQAAFYRIGIGRADVVQAGLFSNPSLSAAFRFPSGGGLTIIDAGIAQSIADLWQIPLRERVAEQDLERTVLEVAGFASALGLDTKRAYYASRFADAAVDVATENVATAQELLDLALARQEAGAGNEIDVNVALSDLLQQKLAHKAARLQAFEERRTLAILMGVESDPEKLVLTDAEPDHPAALPSLETLLLAAGEYRLDLLASRHLVEAAVHRLRLEQRSISSEVEAGVEMERDEDDVFSMGPGFALELPVFDQNQAQIARARYQYQEAKRLLTALTRTVHQDVRGAARRAETAWEVVAFYETELLPRQSESLELAREAYRLGKTSFLSVLEAQNSFLDARRDFINARGTSAEAAVDLESVTGRPLRFLLQAESDTPESPAPEQETEDDTDASRRGN